MRTIKLAGVLCSFLALGSVLSVLGGCGSGSGTATGGDSATATRLVASWHLVSVSGGFSGNGYPVTSDMETLTFNQNGTFTRTISGQTTSGTFQVTDRKTSLSNDKLPVITYSTTTSAEVVAELDTQHLVISDDTIDSFVREYDRLSPLGQ